MLSVTLLEVAKSTDELFARDVLVVREEVSLGGLASVVDQDVGIRGHTCDGADHVAMEAALVRTKSYRMTEEGKARAVTDVLIQDVQFFGRRILLEELRRHFSFRSQDNSILG